MIGPYQMVFVNLLGSLLVFGGALFYRYIFPKKKINLLALLLIISILPLISILRTGVYESGDFNLHTYRTISFFQNLTEGHFVPTWAGELNGTFGYPLFIFIYPLPYYLISLFHFLNFSFIDSLKLFLCFSYLFSGLAMYFWIKDLFGKTSGFVSSIFYLFVPYHLIDLHFRVDIGETLAFVFLPLTLLFARKIIRENDFKWLLLESLAIVGLVLSHQAVSISFIPFIIVYALFEYFSEHKNQSRKIVNFFISFSLGIFLSAFYWLPALIEGIYTKRAEFSSILSFVNFDQLLYSPWRFGFLFQGPKGELSYLVGYAQWVVILTVFYFIFKNKLSDVYQKKLLLILLLAFFVIFFLMLPISSPIWNIFPLLKNFQFTSRLLAIEALFTSAMAGILVKNFKRKQFIYLLCLLAIFSTILNWGNRRTIPQITDSILKQNVPLSTVAGEGLQPSAPQWVDSKQIWINVVPKQHLQILSGKAIIKSNFRSTTLHEYSITANTPAYFRENTLYFPGWNLYLNDKKQNVIVSNSSPSGVIEFKTQKGVYNVKLRFEDTMIQSIAKIASLMAFLFTVIYGIYLNSSRFLLLFLKYYNKINTHGLN